MSTADKLSYLNDTKSLLKDRLNSLGAEITSVTTFRNYLNWLDTFYGEVSDKTDLSQNGVVGRTNQNTAILPSEYTQVDYIESHKASYIDTNVIPTFNTEVELEFLNKDTNSSGFIYGSRIANNNNCHTFILFSSAKDYYPQFGNNSSVVHLSNTYPELALSNTKYKIKNGKNGFYVNNIQIKNYSGQTSLNVPYPMYIFGLNEAGSLENRTAGARIYYFKIYEESILIRDFIPCYRNSDNEVGLYDIVNDVFYTNQGTGAFTYGSVVDIPNPDCPQPINNLTGNVSYNVIGKNLFNKNGTNFDGHTGINNFNGKQLASNSFVGASCYNLVSNNTRCQVYFKGTTGTSYYISFDTTKYKFTTIKAFGSDGIITATLVDQQNITMPNDYLGISLAKVDESDFTDEEVLDLKNTIQIEYGSSSSSYEPYIEPQTFNIPLGDIELCKIDTYEDKIYSSDGRFYLNKKTKKHLFTTSDAIQKGGSSTDGYARCGWGSSSEIATSDFDKILVKCNKFLGVSQNNNNTSLTGEHWYCSLSNTDDFKIMFRCGDTEYTRDTFPEFIKNNEIIVYYPLKEPTTTEITQENYPSLYNALKQIQDYLTAYKINKEFILGYSNPEIEY